MWGDSDLWNVAENFRNWVTEELEHAGVLERTSLRGDYLFIVDSLPRFVVLIDPLIARSVIWDSVEARAIFSPEMLNSLLEGGSRACIETDALSLKKLLYGKMKARQAFLTGKVKISGDLPGFIRLATLLKSRGVRPIAQSDKTIVQSEKEIPQPENSL